MSDPFVPEADAIDQHRDTLPPEPGSEPGEADEGDVASGVGRGWQAELADAGRALTYPDRKPLEAPEADVLDQAQAVATDDDWR